MQHRWFQTDLPQHEDPSPQFRYELAVKSIENLISDETGMNGNAILDSIRKLIHQKMDTDTIWFSTIQCCRLLSACKMALQQRNADPHATIEMVTALTREMIARKMLPDIVVFNTLLDLHAKCGDPLSTIRIWEQMRNVGMQPDNFTVTTLLTAYCTAASDGAISREETTKQAWLLFEELKNIGVNPNATAISSLANVLVEANDQDGFKRVIREAEQLGLLPYDINVLNVYLKGAAQFGDLHRAFDLFDKAMQSGISPDTITLLSLLRICVMLRDSPRAWKLYEDFKTHGLEPSFIVISSLMNVMVETSDRNGFRRSIVEAENLGFLPFEIGVLNVCFKGFAQFGNSSLAFELFDKVRRSGTRPDCVTLMHLLSICSKLRDSRRAWQIVEEFKRMNVPLDAKATSSLMNVMVEANDKDGFFRAEQALRSSGFRLTPSWNITIKGYSRFHEDINKAISVLDEMRSHGDPPNAITLFTLLVSCSYRDDIDNAHKLFHQLKDEGVETNAKHLDVLLVLAMKTRNIDKFEEAVRMVQDSKFKHDQKLQDRIIQGRCKLSQFDTTSNPKMQV